LVISARLATTYSQEPTKRLGTERQEESRQPRSSLFADEQLVKQSEERLLISDDLRIRLRVEIEA
jgi:hypothetical protein